MTCRFDLKRFVDAQSPVFDQVCSELRAGEKRSHWMWYIFPQISGLGSSGWRRRCHLFARRSCSLFRASRSGAKAPILCAELVNAIEGRSVEQIFGYPDHHKFHSSMTLFANSEPEGPSSTLPCKSFSATGPISSLSTDSSDVLAPAIVQSYPAKGLTSV